MKTLKDLNFLDKRVIVRCDFNVPLDETGNILDDFRIKQVLPTIKYLIEQKAKIVLMSHIGRPEGKVVENLRLNAVAQKISDLLNISIRKENDCIGPEVEIEVNKLKQGEILMLENLRFYKEEEENNNEFAKKLSYLGDIYVNDAFANCHRSHASIVGLPLFLPSCAGLLLEKEVSMLDKIIKNPEKPMIAIIGGKKVDTKSSFINCISRNADFVIISGLIAKEVVDKKIKFDYPEKIITPVGDLSALDISDESIKTFQEKIAIAKTIFWNGAFGKFEEESCEKGTLAIANAIINSGAFSVVGGGETVEFIDKKGIINSFSHVSTGGGAMLDYLSDQELPGIEALK